MPVRLYQVVAGLVALVATLLLLEQGSLGITILIWTVSALVLIMFVMCVPMVTRRASGGIDIAGSASSLFDWYSDPATIVDPKVSVNGIQIDPPGPLREGSSFRYVLAVGSRRVPCAGDVLEYVPPRLFSVRSKVGACRFTNSVHIKPIDDLTRVEESV